MSEYIEVKKSDYDELSGTLINTLCRVEELESVISHVMALCETGEVSADELLWTIKRVLGDAKVD